MVYRTPNGLFMVDTSTKAITTLSSNTDDESYGEVKFTPDGQKVVFFRVGLNPTPNNLFVVDIDGSNLTQLSNYTATTLFAGIETYEISPDGSTVVYYGEVNYWPGVKELYRVDIDGSNNLRVHSSLVGTSKDIMGDIYIAPDSSYFVFSGDITTDTVNEVYAADIDGSNMRRLNPTSNANRDANVSTEDISISSDSTLIYFTGDFTVDGRADWYSSTPDGATVVNLTNFPAAGTSIQNRILTSDESTLISVRSVSGEVRLFTTNLGTRVSTDITGSLVSGGDVRTSSAWDYTFLSPDETQVYFAGDLVVDGQNDLYKVPIGGGSRTTLRSGTAGLKHVITNDGTRIISIENECVSVLSSNGTGLIDYANLATNETVHKCTYLPTKDKVLLIKDLVSGARQMTIHNIDGSVHKEISAPLSKSYTRLSLQISDDKTKMAYLVDGHIYVAGMDGSNPIKVSQYPLSSWSIWSVFSITLTDPSDMYKFSPDGQHIAYIGIDLSTGISNLHTVRVDGSSHNTLTTQTIYEQINGFKFSPDGTKIAILDEEGNPEVNGGRLIFVSDIDGSNQVQIAQDYTDSTRYISHYTEKDPYHFTSDSQYIIYISRGDWCYNIDGSVHKEISAPLSKSYTRLSLQISDDKTKMAYLVDGHIYVAGMDGSNPIKVSQYPLSSWSIWSVFSITLTDPSDMYKFSPDGQHIAYIGIDLSTGISNLHTVRVDGSSHNTLTTQTIYEQINGFKFSPDGTKIAILDEEGNPEVNGGRLIFVSDIDGSNQVQIAQDYTDSTRYISHYTEKDPYHFTSDSQYIIYISRGDWCCSGAVSMENVYANKVDGSDYREIGNAANNSSEILILSASNTALYAQGGVLNTVDVTTGTKTPLSTVCKPGSAVEIQSRGEIACENGGEIFLVKLDGSTHSSVHTEEALYSSYTSTPIPFKLSSDEKYIVYAAFLAASTQQYKIFSYNLDTGVNKTLSPTLKVGSFQFEYIPNQQSIIYSGLDWNENKGILRKINLDGTGEVIIESSLGDVILTDQFHFSHTENYVIYPVINTPFDGVRVKISTYDTSVQEFLNEGDPVVFYNFYSEDHILLGSESGDDSDAHYVLKRTTIGDPTPEP